MNKTLKAKWLKAFEITLKEYKDNNHDTLDCSLCLITTKGASILDNGPDCAKCPMNVFKIDGWNRGCSNRKIACKHSDYITTGSIQHKALVNFYTLAVDLWKELDTKEYKTFDDTTDTSWSRLIKVLDSYVHMKWYKEKY